MSDKSAKGDLTRQQSDAINGSGNLLVVAGAGTGKTHTLIARALRLIREGASLENILMVTFTEAAAAEMRGRLREELLKLQGAEPTDQRLAEQLALLDSARISTLHGFCLQLAREHFHELGLDPQFGVLDEQQSRPLQRQALDDLLERHYSGTGAESLATQELIRTVGRGLDRPIRQHVLKLHAYTQSLPDPAAWLDDQQKHFQQDAPSAWRELFLRAAADWRKERLPQLEEFSAVPAVAICLDALTKLPAKPSATDAAKTFGTVLEAAARKENWEGNKTRVYDRIGGFFDDAGFLAALAPQEGRDPLLEDWNLARRQMLALLALTREFSADYAARKREVAGADFTDLEQLALRALRLPGVADAWRARLEHVFVDEYQDINAAQDAILTALSRAGSPGNRFLVGDVKQSIYRFRLANPKIFQRYQKTWSGPKAGGRALSLTENFRSRKALLDFVNPLFGALMCEGSGDVKYEALEFGAAHQRAALAGAGPMVELHLIARADGAEPDGGEDEASETSADLKSSPPDLLTAEREARLVARKLGELHAQNLPVWDKEQKCFRAVKWSDMAVLMRSPAGRAEAFAMEFSKAGVPLSAARDGFFGSLEISDLISLLRLLDNPLQDVPLVAVLRSPLVGLTLTELAEIRTAGGQKELFWEALKNIQHPTSNTQHPISAKAGEFLKQYARWRELVRQTSLTQTLETVLNETHYVELLLAGERGEERAANVQRLLDLARQFDPYQRQGLYRFLRFVQQQEDEDLDLQPAAAATEDAVRLVSIHRSKGLEFPVVALAGLGTRFNEQGTSAGVLLHETLGLCPKISPPDAEENYASLTHWLARRDERRELRGEELRLFYVALTRARDRLVLVGTSPRKAEDLRWQPAEEALASESAAQARSHLDWLLAWLQAATTAEQWQDDRRGGNELLTWAIRDAHDPVFADIGAEPNAVSPRPGLETWPSAETMTALQSRLEWQYPFGAATTEPAKATVSALRRRVVDETEESVKLFRVEGYKLPVTGPKGRTKTGLSAAARGTAHHIFLQNVEPTSSGSDLDFHNEAQRMLGSGLLSPEEVAALDFAALRNFWDSDFGRAIRTGSARQVHREMQFTARLSIADLRALGLPATGADLRDDEFIVVQGVADLVLLYDKEIRLLDFKTDHVSGDALAARAKFYEPQLRLYALALSRIYQRPVSDCRLWFLASGTPWPVI